MSNTVIKVESLSKLYHIGTRPQGYKTFREAIVDTAKGPFRLISTLLATPSSMLSSQGGTIWALNDVSFDVRQGEVVGIIGRNGAGKSTLLKVLSKITEPTKGRIELKGRVGSLLEVGTGFHPELTGHENVYLYGAILGMDRWEVTRKFDEVVAFAELEQFIDTPVKRYSSGMYMRLAFAVAAHLEPEILLVDEVLAVGDAEFQKKCMGKMHDVSNQGRTVLFVSHNMGAVASICRKGIILSQGAVSFIGPAKDAVGQYLGGDVKNKLLHVTSEEKPHPYFRKVRVQPHDVAHSLFYIDQPIKIHFEIEHQGRSGLVVSIVIRDSSGQWVHHSSNEFSNGFSESLVSDVSCLIPAYGLSEGKYFVDVYLAQRARELHECIENVLVLDIEFFGVMANASKGSDWKGVCGPGLLQWL